MTADPTPAPYPRLAELPEPVAAMCEALHGTGVGCPYDEHWRAQEHDAEWHGLHAIAILALLPARTATTEAEALEACTGTDEDCPHHDCPDGWHYGSDLPCSCSPDCATAIAAGPAARPGGGR
jgi:hypothetical protein